MVKYHFEQIDRAVAYTYKQLLEKLKLGGL